MVRVPGGEMPCWLSPAHQPHKSLQIESSKEADLSIEVSADRLLHPRLVEELRLTFLLRVPNNVRHGLKNGVSVISKSLRLSLSIIKRNVAYT